MAIQMRRGPLAQYDESKMLAGEWGISIDADSNDQKAFIAFAPGVSKEVMMVEDAQEQIAAATAEAIVDATAKAEAYAHGDSFSVNDYASGDGTTTSFTLSETPSSVIAVYVDGAETTAYTRSGAVITFTTAPPVGEDNIRVSYTVNTTSDNAMYYKNQAASSASSASTSAQTATTQATNAANARQAIENMTASASSLPPGSAATVTKTTVSGVVNLAFGIPIGKDGEKGETSGIPVEELTQAQYDALPEASKLDEKLYLITDGDSGWEAESVEYDNTESGLTADNVQDAVDELSGAVDALTSSLNSLIEVGTITVNSTYIGTVYANMVCKIGNVVFYMLLAQTKAEVTSNTSFGTLPYTANDRADTMIMSQTNRTIISSCNIASNSNQMKANGASIPNSATFILQGVYKAK